MGCRPGFSRRKTSSCGLLIQVGLREEVRDGQFNWGSMTVTCGFAFRLHCSSGQVDGQNTAHDQTLPVPQRWSHHHCAGDSGIPLSVALQHLEITRFSCFSLLVGGERIWQLLRVWLQLPASPGQAVPLSPWWRGGAVHYRWSRNWLPQVWLDTGTLRHSWLWARWVLPSNMLCLSVEIYIWLIVFWFFTPRIRRNVWFSFFDSFRVECDGRLQSPETRWTSGAFGRCPDCHVWPLFKYYFDLRCLCHIHR